MKNENLDMCKSIAQDIEDYYNGDVVRIDGENYNHDDIWDEEKDCYVIDGEEIDEAEPEPVGLWDYFEDCFDIEITKSLGSDDIRYCRIMIACGGPNIWIDTGKKAVCLYWWTEKADYPIPREICDAIDDYIQELASCY